MKEGTRKKLDAIQYSESKKQLVLIVSAIALFLIIAAVSVPIYSTTVYGVTKGFTSKHTEISTSAAVTVILISGEQVLAEFPKTHSLP